MKLLDRINNYMSNDERWHEWGLILFYGMIQLVIVAQYPSIYTWIALNVINIARVIYQEIGIERDWESARINHDFYYDTFIRPAGSAIIGLFPLLPPHTWLSFLALTLFFTYKFRWFNL